jgi:hypothetical protein
MFKEKAAQKKEEREEHQRTYKAIFDKTLKEERSKAIEQRAKAEAREQALKPVGIKNILRDRLAKAKKYVAENKEKNRSNVFNFGGNSDMFGSGNNSSFFGGSNKKKRKNNDW